MLSCPECHKELHFDGNDLVHVDDNKPLCPPSYTPTTKEEMEHYHRMEQQMLDDKGRQSWDD